MYIANRDRLTYRRQREEGREEGQNMGMQLTYINYYV